MNLENKKYGEVIIKIPLKKLNKLIKFLKTYPDEKSIYETKIYKTHFVKFLKKGN